MKQKISYFFKQHPTLSFISIGVLFALIEGLYSFCTPKSAPLDAQCPTFADADFDNWFPYQQNQSLFFISSLAKKDTITIESIIKSAPYATSSSMINQCGASAQIYSVQTYSSPYTKKFSASCYKNSGSKQLQINLYNFTSVGEFKDGSFTPLPINPFISQSFSSITINGRNFTNVIEITRDTIRLAGTGVYKLWLSKQNGLVGYETNPSYERWVLQ